MSPRLISFLRHSLPRPMKSKGMIVTVKRFQKRVTFNANGLKSYSTVTALTARNEWDTRIANGAVVTDFNLDKMPRSEYAPMAVG